jgi:hypothetical protein
MLAPYLALFVFPRVREHCLFNTMDVLRSIVSSVPYIKVRRGYVSPFISKYRLCYVFFNTCQSPYIQLSVTAEVLLLVGLYWIRSATLNAAHMTFKARQVHTSNQLRNTTLEKWYTRGESISKSSVSYIVWLPQKEKVVDWWKTCRRFRSWICLRRCGCVPLSHCMPVAG